VREIAGEHRASDVDAQGRGSFDQQGAKPFERLVVGARDADEAVVDLGRAV
jgi:hypothetical protein